MTVSGDSGSLDSTVMRNSWGPPIPSGMWVATRSVPDSPGARVVELTTGLGGQHPSTATIVGGAPMVSGASPTFR